ncbi:MAG: XRE family transcriptional regulator [Actinomycetota bacterium]|nr:XRE family transcriptional regulator [Actinomycetota bacterium]
MTMLDDAERWASLGTAIRERRLAGEFTMVELAERAGLSQPFLSQIENGRARPSMQSLYRIATALATTPQALFGGPSVAAEPTLARAAAPDVPMIATDGESLRRLLLPGAAPFHVIELVGLAHEFLEPWSHDGFEALYVIAGPVDVDVAGAITTLDAGDFLSYPSRLPHRYRSVRGAAARVLLIETQASATGQGAHAASHQ